MTLTTPYSATFVIGDGETKEFSYLFEEVSENFIKVIVKHSDDSTYTPVFSVDLDSHKVVFGESETAPLDTDLVCIYRQTPDLQDTPFRTLQGYDARALENILSKIVAMIQELKANGFSTQILQGTPWQLDLLHPDDDGASVVVDYNARILKKGLYFQIVSGNLQVSADGNSFISMPKSADITEFRCLETVLEDLTVIRKLQYKVNNVWYDAEHNAQATADEALTLAQTVQGDLSSHKLNHNNPHETSLSNLTDTDITNPALGHFLRFDGTKWANSSSDVTSVDWGEIEGDIADQTDLKNALDDKADAADLSSKVNIDGTSIMTAPLKFMSGSVRGAVGPYFNGVGFWKLDSQGNLTQIASISDSQFIPTTTSAIDIGNSTKKWKDLYLSGKAYVGTINNGYDISVPAYTGTMIVADFTGATAGQILALDSNLKPVWQDAPTIPTVGDGTITITQGGTTKGTFTVNQSGDTTIDLDAGGGSSNYHPDLFDWKWADHTLNDVQWLRADTFSWQSGAVYEAAYNHLADDLPAEVPAIGFGTYEKTYYTRYPEGDVSGDTYPYCWRKGTSDRYTASETPAVGDNAHTTSTGGISVEITDIGSTLPIPETETISGITISFYTANDGHKICLADQESNVAAIYTATGVAWYYIIDTVNERFKLPRSKHEHYGDRPVIGDGKGLGLTDGTKNLGVRGEYAGNTYPVTTATGGYGKNVGDTAGTISSIGNKVIGVVTDATKSGIISTPVQDTDQYKYLYFYVGEFTQEAIENTAGLNAESFNDKLDLDVGNATATTKGTVVGWGMPDYSAGVTAPSSNTTALTNLYVKGNASSGNTAHIYINDIDVANGWEGFVCAYVPKGATFRITGVTAPVYYPLIGG